MQQQIKPLPAREMHKYVLGLFGLWVLFCITFSISCIRVSQDKTVSSGTTEKNLQVLGVADGSNQTQTVNTISDRQPLRGLNRKLYEQVAKNWQPGQKLFERKLVYRVSMSQDGVIGSYKPVNQAASDYVQDTPLSDWSKENSPNNAPKQDLVDFEVVFTRQGILEVTPWDGWK